MAATHALPARTGLRHALRGLSVSGWIGLSILILFTVLALIGPLIAPYSPTAQDLDGAFQGQRRALDGPDEQGWTCCRCCSTGPRGRHHQRLGHHHQRGVGVSLG